MNWCGFKGEALVVWQEKGAHSIVKGGCRLAMREGLASVSGSFGGVDNIFQQRHLHSGTVEDLIAVNQPKAVIDGLRDV